MNSPKYMVRVSCMTYNHAAYIEDAMNGFCMQDTSFPFVCTILDDCSTDGEQEVIKKYLQEHFNLEDSSVVRNEETDDYILTFAQHKTNINCYFAVYFLKYNHYSIRKSKGAYYKEWSHTKYVALCEGDDYWIVPFKLKNQVKFLEEHPDFSMCFHGACIKYESGSFHKDRKHQFDGLETREYSGDELIRKWIVPTASMVFRSNIVFPRDSRLLVGDIVVVNQCTIEGKIYCFSTEMSVYRLTASGITNNPTWVSIEKRINHYESLVAFFPQYRWYYVHLMRKDIIRSLLSRKCLHTVLVLIKRPRLLNYFRSITITD